MDYTKYFAFAGSGQKSLLDAEPADAVRHIVRMDENVCPGARLLEAFWLTAPCKADRMIRRDTDVMLVFIGSDVENGESLNAEIELWIENDMLVLRETCAVFIPAGAAYGRLRVADMDRPVLCYYSFSDSGTDKAEPAQATAPVGTYADNVRYKYAPPNGELPDAPEGFLKLLLYLSSERLDGAPYMETVWFKTDNDTGPAPHVHADFPEFIGFLGTDPENPQELGAEVRFYMGDEREYVATTRSTIIHIPAGVLHGPIIVPQLSRPIIHFSGNDGREYIRDDIAEGGNMYKVE